VAMRFSRSGQRMLAGGAVLTLLVGATQGANKTLDIQDVLVQTTARPNERVCVLFRTDSSSEVKADVRWGTSRGHYTHVSATETKTKGLRSFAVPVQSPDLPCTVYYVIHATNAQGESRDSAEHSWKVEYPPVPPGALGFVVKPEKAIPDDKSGGITAEITVHDSGTLMRAEVRVDVTHPRRGDLSVTLVSPSGTHVKLHGPSSDTTPNLRGTYGDGVLGDLEAAQSLAVLQGEPIHGKWKLLVADMKKGDKGKLDAFGLTLFLEQASGPRSPDEALPDMVMQPPTQISIEQVGNQKQLQFSTTFANMGPGPLMIRGQWNKQHQILDAYQQIYIMEKDAQGNFKDFKFSREQLVGEFVTTYDGDFHFADWAQYTLLDEQFKAAPGAVGNLKMTFAIEDVFQVDKNLPGSPSSGVYTSSQFLQGISVGWADTYGAGLDGQSIDITHTPNGTYYLVLHGSRILDESNSDKTNNDSAAKIKIEGDHVTVLAKYTGTAFHALESAVHYKADVQPIWNNHCTVCHARTAARAPFSLDASNSWQSIVNVDSLEAPALKRVKPGDPNASYLWHKVNGTQTSVGGSGATMPEGGHLTAAELATIEKWISAGAKDD